MDSQYSPPCDCLGEESDPEAYYMSSRTDSVELSQENMGKMGFPNAAMANEENSGLEF